MDRTAVSLSFWVGGCGLVVLKGLAYAATGSILVRAAMFESIGDVLSSFILWLTQKAMSNVRDPHLYPVGRHRFAPLGVLFFCAFMISSMCGMALEAFQQVIASEAGGEDGGSEAAAHAVRRLAEDYWWLRLLSGRSVDALVANYGVAPPGGDDSSDDSDSSVSVRLMALCVVVKLVLYLYCKAVNRVQNSDIVKALATDHFNDTISTLAVIGAMWLVSFLEQQGYGGPLLAKVDPASSLLLSLWIIYGWVSQALDQVKVLSDRRAEDEDVDARAIREAVQLALEKSHLELSDVDVYHAGEGFRLRLDLRPATGDGGDREELAAALAAAQEAAQRAAGSAEVHAVEVSIRPRSAPRGSAAPDDWVREYARPMGP